MVGFVTQNEASHLLHNKFVVILCGSVPRSMYKDPLLEARARLMTKGPPAGGLISAPCEDKARIELRPVTRESPSLIPQIPHLELSMRCKAMEANFCSSQLARACVLDVLDLHFHRMPAGIRWDAVAPRRASTLLLHPAPWG
ncbi:unnamed protein product [Lota lota]